MQTSNPPEKRPAIINLEKERQRQKLRKRLLEMILRNQALIQSKPR